MIDMSIAEIILYGTIAGIIGAGLHKLYVDYYLDDGKITLDELDDIAEDVKDIVEDVKEALE
jgi:hypothetical protein|tara:strand:+ start:145 stop:330 length:186 start_codon:yes stop_codon:yes gene_type:complete